MSARRTSRGAAPEQATPDPSAGAPYTLEDQIGFRLRKAHQRASEIFNAVMAEFDVTPMQFAVLARLDDLGTVSQNQLGRHVAMDPATIFGVIGRLAKRGLVSQRADPGDARLSLIELTAEGRTLIAGMKRRGPEVSARTLSPLSAEEARVMLDLLQRIG